MSLDKLRRLRRSGRKPHAAIVFIGKPQVVYDDEPGIVVVDRDGVDLRPLVGLPVHIIDLQDDADFALRVTAELEELGATLLGACGSYGAQGVSAEHEAAMRRYRRSMCTTN